MRPLRKTAVSSNILSGATDSSLSLLLIGKKMDTWTPGKAATMRLISVYYVVVILLLFPVLSLNKGSTGLFLIL